MSRDAAGIPTKGGSLSGRAGSARSAYAEARAACARARRRRARSRARPRTFGWDPRGGAAPPESALVRGRGAVLRAVARDGGVPLRARRTIADACALRSGSSRREARGEAPRARRCALLGRDGRGTPLRIADCAHAARSPRSRRCSTKLPRHRQTRPPLSAGRRRRDRRAPCCVADVHDHASGQLNRSNQRGRASARARGASVGASRPNRTCLRAAREEARPRPLVATGSVYIGGIAREVWQTDPPRSRYAAGRALHRVALVGRPARALTTRALFGTAEPLLSGPR